MTLKLLTEHHFEFLSLTVGRTGSAESTLVKIPHFWKSHFAAQIILNSFLGICIFYQLLITIASNLDPVVPDLDPNGLTL